MCIAPDIALPPSTNPLKKQVKSAILNHHKQK